MGLQADVQTAAEDFIAKTAQLVVDAENLRAIMTGPASGAGSTVDTGGPSPVSTLAKLMADYASSGIADNGVTTAKILALAVTTGKIADLAVTAAKIAAGAVDFSKLASDVAPNVSAYSNWQNFR